MLRKFIFKYNNIDFQDLKTAYELSYTSWNNIINQLREQTNNSTTYIETLNTWLFGPSDVPYEYTEDFGDYTNFYDYVQGFIQKAQSSIADLKIVTAKKLNKVSVPSIVYATDSSGVSTHVSYSTTPIAKAIVQRDENGQIKVNTPVNDDDSVNKKYVDDHNNNLKKYVDDYNNIFKEYVDRGFVTNTKQPNQIYGTNEKGENVTLSHEALQPSIILRYPHSDNFPVVGNVKKFYISERDGIMYYWDGKTYQEAGSGATDFDVIDGGNAEEYEYTTNIFDGGGA